MFAVYITHLQVRIDPDVPVPRWGLSDVGAARSRTTASRPWVRPLSRIIANDETKAIETAEILAAAAGVALEVMAGMHENDRSATGFLPPPEFEQAADWFFAHPLENFKGWVRSVDAQARIAADVEAVLKDHDPTRPIAFVGHGGVGTLLKCHLQNAPITCSKDQSPGSGNLFAFDLAHRRVSCDWTAMEEWQGWDHGRARPVDRRP